MFNMSIHSEGMPHKTLDRLAPEDVEASDLTTADLPELKGLFERNRDHFASGGFVNANHYEEFEKRLRGERHDDDMRLVGMRVNNTLVGFGTAVPDAEITGAYEIAGAVDQEYTRRGIALAALTAFVDYEDNLGHDLTAEVRTDNYPVIMLLDKLDFVRKRRREENVLYVRKAMGLEEFTARFWKQ